MVVSLSVYIHILSVYLYLSNPHMEEHKSSHDLYFCMHQFTSLSVSSWMLIWFWNIWINSQYLPTPTSHPLPPQPLVGGPGPHFLPKSLKMSNFNPRTTNISLICDKNSDFGLRLPPPWKKNPMFGKNSFCQPWSPPSGPVVAIKPSEQGLFQNSLTYQLVDKTILL